MTTHVPSVAMINAARVDPKPLIDVLRMKRSARSTDPLRILTKAPALLQLVDDRHAVAVVLVDYGDQVQFLQFQDDSGGLWWLPVKALMNHEVPHAFAHQVANGSGVRESLHGPETAKVARRIVAAVAVDDRFPVERR